MFTRLFVNVFDLPRRCGWGMYCDWCGLEWPSVWGSWSVQSSPMRSRSKLKLKSWGSESEWEFESAVVGLGMASTEPWKVRMCFVRPRWDMKVSGHPANEHASRLSIMVLGGTWVTSQAQDIGKVRQFVCWKQTLENFWQHISNPTSFDPSPLSLLLCHGSAKSLECIYSPCQSSTRG